MSESSVKKYDVVVLGSGEGGKFVAWTLARQGKKVAVIERRYIGGSCPNIACLPSKNVIHSAKVASYFYRSEEFGISKENVRISMPAVREHKRKMVDGLIQMHLDNYKASGAELILGSGRFVGPKAIEVELSEGGTVLVRGEDNFCPLPMGVIQAAPTSSSLRRPDPGKGTNGCGRQALDRLCRPGGRHVLVCHLGSVKYLWLQPDRHMEAYLAAHPDAAESGDKAYRALLEKALQKLRRGWLPTGRGPRTAIRSVLDYAAEKNVRLGLENRERFEELPVDADFPGILAGMPPAPSPPDTGTTRATPT